MKKISNWVKRNKVETAFLIALIVLTLFVRFYKISEYMTFLGDEGRDAIIVKTFLVNLDPPFLGPATSVGNMYLGPLYYYMMTVAMGIFWLNPVAAAGMVAVIGTLTVGLIYYLAREWFGRVAAFSAAILYSLSPVNIIYSRSSWNPNPTPFFALLIILSLYYTYKTKNYKWLLLTGVAFAFIIQMHYLALIILPVIGVLWLLEFITQIKKNKQVNKSFTKYSLFAILLFLFLMSPLVLFDLKHDLMNYRALSAFFSNRETTVNLNVFNTLGRVVPIYSNNLIARYLTFGNNNIASVMPLLLLSPVLLLAFTTIKNKKINWPIFALFNWLIIGVLGLALYKQTIYDHYIGFLNPVPYLLLSSLFSIKFSKKIYSSIFYLLLVVIVGLLTYSNIYSSPLKQQPNNQLARTQKIAKLIIQETNGKPFNFALIAEHNYDPAYQFYLDIYGHPPGKLPFIKTDQLFVVCEDPICIPVGHPKQEISHFGWAKIEYQKEAEGLKYFKLIQNNPDATNSAKLKQ